MPYFHIFLLRWVRSTLLYRGDSRRPSDSITSYFTLLQSTLQPLTRRLYPYIINVDCCVVYMHHIPRNPPGADRIVLSLYLPPSSRHPTRRQYYHGRICTRRRSPPQIIQYMSPTEREREVGVNQDVVRERGKDIKVQPIPLAPPASLTIIHRSEAFSPPRWQPGGTPISYQS